MRLLVALRYLFLVVKGALVGFGAILPGVSGGTLCVAFGMYRPILNLLSHPVKTIKEDGLKLLAFIAGGGIGFIFLAGVVEWLLRLNAEVVICVFVGFVLGTVPELWQTAGTKKRGTGGYLSLAISFAALLALMIVLKSNTPEAVEGVEIVPLLNPNFVGFLICGILWGLSFIVPGMSSSTLIMFIGLYTQMTGGIKSLDMQVLVPLMLGAGGCALLLARPINWLFDKYHSVMSHSIIGLMFASTIMVVPFAYFSTAPNIIIGIVCILCGAATSYALGLVCNKLPQKTE